ncbi:hypothetical protein FB451DRAFT_1180812 [Mycena latifolia]|nr:hypothetical protein FB451DRAFT_1180812 [Mycena latifolia]
MTGPRRSSRTKTGGTPSNLQDTTISPTPVTPRTRQRPSPKSPAVKIVSAHRHTSSKSTCSSKPTPTSKLNASKNDSTDEDEEEDETEEEEENPARDEEEEDDGSGTEDAPANKRKKTASCTDDSPKEIVFNISVFSAKQCAKPVKKRSADYTGFMKLTDTTSLHAFDRKLLSKITSIARLGIAPDEDEFRTTFTIPRHVLLPLEIDDLDAYNHMVTNAKKCKDPTVNLAIEFTQTPLETASDKDQKKGKKSKIPSENDILPGNKSINDQIGILRNKWTCNVNGCSDFCWISGDDKDHIPLGHTHFNVWASAILNGACTTDTPPNHKLFDLKGNAAQLAPPTLLQRRAAANQPAVPAAPVINNSFSFPDGFIELLRPNTGPNSPAPPVQSAAPPSHEHDMLLPPNTQAPFRLSVNDFCAQFDLDNSIRDKLTANGYKNAGVFYLIKLSELISMDFLPGEIAELRDAVRQWAVPV